MSLETCPTMTCQQQTLLFYSQTVTFRPFRHQVIQFLELDDILQNFWTSTGDRKHLKAEDMLDDSQNYERF